jgi:hypothetical protein
MERRRLTMKRKTESKVEEVLFWIAAPTMMITEKHPKKWVRLAGAFGTLPLFPLMFLGFGLMCVWMVIVIIDEI